MIPATGSCRKVTGNRPDFSGGFLPTFYAFRQEPAGRNPKNSRPEYCFDKITRITLNRQFQSRILPPGFLFNLIDEINLYLIFILSSVVT
jgi:hypothetical protein